MADTLLAVQGLTKRFGGVVAADAIDFDIEHGEFHAVIGPNGAGKSTFIGLIAGEIAPQQGNIRFAGGDITRLPVYPPQPARPGAVVPDHLAVCRFHRARQCRARGAGAPRPFVPVLAQSPRRRRIARARAGGAGAGRARPSRRNASRQIEPRRAPAARNRHGARGAAAASSARRADGRHGAGRIRPHGRVAARAQGQRDHPVDRARHGSGVCARRPHQRPGLWPRHRLGRRRDGQGRSRRARGLSRRKGRPAAKDPAMAEAPLLELADIETSYGQSRVLFGISLAIAPGEMVSLMGRNGMGKTTTVRSIMGLTRPAAGSIRFAGDRAAQPAGLPHRQARPRAGAGRPPGLSEPHHTRKPRRHRGQPHRRRRSVDAGKSLCAVSAARRPRRAAWRTSCPAANSRCWRSAGRS